MAANMVTEVMEVIGNKRNVCLCCDSWYPKAEITQLPKKYDNLALISNVRHDTVLYDLPPAKTGKKGRPKVRGEKLSFDDFAFSVVDGTDYAVGSRQVITNLFGKKPVHAIVTKTKTTVIGCSFARKTHISSTLILIHQNQAKLLSLQKLMYNFFR